MSALLATLWALWVPVFEEPDELAHLDYAFALYDAGRPFVVQHATAGTDVTPQVRYLESISHYRTMRYNPWAIEPAGYGRTAFLRRVDASAPRPSHRVPPDGTSMPYVMFGYPIGYYAVLALIMSVAGALSHDSISVVFLSARLFNVALLIPTLTLAALIFRQCRLDRSTTLLATVAVGAFPLTSWVAGYAQPDNLSLLLVTAALYYVSRWRDDPSDSRRSVVLAFVLAALFLTKHQYALCAWAAAVLLALTRLSLRPLTPKTVASVAMVALLPLLAFTASLLFVPVTRLSATGSFLGTALLQMDFQHAGRLALQMLFDGLDAYAGGNAFTGYWFHFGFRMGQVFPAAALPWLREVLAVLSLAAVVLFASLQLRRLSKIARVWKSRSSAVALRLTAAGVAINIYVALTLILCAAQAASNGELELEGRYWLPVIVPAVLIVLVEIPKLIGRRAERRIVRVVAAGTMACYSLVASVCALAAMHADFYRPSPLTARRDTVAKVVAIQAAGRQSQSIPGTIVLPEHRATVVRGYAVDMVTGLPATRVSLRIDGGQRHYAVTGLSSVSLARFLHDDAIRKSAFGLRLPPDTLKPGRHHFLVEIDDPQLAWPLAVGRRFDVAVTASDHLSQR